MKLLRLALPAAALFGALALQALACAGKPVVILISWDGVRHDYPDRVELPALGRMEREGARAGRLAPVFPSDTFPNHVALATGASTDRHGIVANSFFDRERGFFARSNDASWIEAEPLWVAAERQGVRAAVFFWVGSETDWHGVGASYRKSPFDSTVPESVKVDQILDWLDLPAAERPRLIMSYWRGADRVAHERGPEHEEVWAQLRRQDAQLGRLFEGLDARGAWRHATVIVVTDHGMTSVDRVVPVREALDRAGIRARVPGGSAAAYVFLEERSELGAAERVLGSIDGVRVFRREAIPKELRIRHARTGDLLVTTDPPNTLIEGDLLAYARRTPGWTRGMHGYPPDHPDMGGIFLALGRGVRAGGRPLLVRAIDVAPTVARLLGIDPPRDAEGQPVAGIGAAGPRP